MFSQLIMTVKGLAVIFAAIHACAWLLRKEDSDWLKGSPRTIFVTLFLIGMWGHTVWVPYLALIAIIPILARNRADAAAFYAFTILAIPGMETKVAVGSLYLFPLNKWVFCALGLGVAFVIKPPSQGKTPVGRFDLPFLIFVLLEIAHTRDPNVTDMMRLLVPLIISLVVPYFAISRSLKTEEDVRRFILALAIGGVIMAIVAIVESQLHWLIYKTIESNLDLGGRLNPYRKLRGGFIRAPASFPESTTLALYLAIAGVALFALRRSFASDRRWYAAIGLIVLGLLAANSRGGFIGIAIGIAAFDFFRRNYAALAGKIFVGGLAYTLFRAAAEVSYYFASVVGNADATASSSDYRRLLLRRGLEEIHKHPLFGVPLQQALNNLQDIKQGEGIVDMVNGYVAYGLTSGYPGIIGLLLVFVMTCIAMLYARRRLGPDGLLSQSAAFIFAVSAYTSAASFFTGFGGENGIPFLEVCAVGSVIWALRRQGGAAPSASVVPARQDLVPSIRQRILADRAAAGTKGGSPATLAHSLRTDTSPLA